MPHPKGLSVKRGQDVVVITLLQTRVDILAENQELIRRRFIEDGGAKLNSVKRPQSVVEESCWIPVRKRQAVGSLLLHMIACLDAFR